MQTAQVIYLSLLNIKRFPTYMERVKLEELQMELNHAYWELKKIKDVSKYDFAASKQIYHNRRRESFKLL